MGVWGIFVLFVWPWQGYSKATACPRAQDETRRHVGSVMGKKRLHVPIWFSTNQRANCLEGPSPFLLTRLTRTVLFTVCMYRGPFMDSFLLEYWRFVVEEGRESEAELGARRFSWAAPLGCWEDMIGRTPVVNWRRGGAERAVAGTRQHAAATEEKEARSRRRLVVACGRVVVVRAARAVPPRVKLAGRSAISLFWTGRSWYGTGYLDKTVLGCDSIR